MTECLFANLVGFMNAATAIVAAASAIAALTPSKTDDAVCARLRKLVDFLALNVGYAKK